jgi:hypothetical protein
VPVQDVFSCALQAGQASSFPGQSGIVFQGGRSGAGWVISHGGTHRGQAIEHRRTFLCGGMKSAGRERTMTCPVHPHRLSGEDPEGSATNEVHRPEGAALYAFVGKVDRPNGAPALVEVDLHAEGADFIVRKGSVGMPASTTSFVAKVPCLAWAHCHPHWR